MPSCKSGWPSDAEKKQGQIPWPEIARRVKDAAGWHCVRCGAADDRESGHMLTVHHLDLDKSNCSWWNLVALCQRCHLHIQGKVIMHQPFMFDHSDWFKPYVAGYYAHQNSLPENKQDVMKNMDDLLEYGKPGQVI
jgi:hypothetical protein